MSLAPLLVRSTRIFAGFPPVIVQAYVRKVISSASSTRIVAQSLRNKNRRLHLSKNIKFLLLLNGTSIVLVFCTCSEVPVSELSLELLLLQVVLPALLEQGHTRQWLKKAMRGWAVAVAFIL